MNMKRKMYILIVLLGFIPCIQTSGVQASGVKVETRGVGYVTQGNIANARDRAITDAKIRAVELVCGTKIDSKTVIYRTLLIGSTVSTQAKGVVRKFKVISESLDKKFQLYYVTIEAEVDQDTLDNEFLKRAGEKQILFMREKSQEKDVVLARELAKLFGSAGFSISQVFADKSEFDILSSGTATTILQGAKKDVLIVFNLDNKEVHCRTSNFCSARAEGSIQLYAPFNHSGPDILMADEKFDKVKGFGNTELSAKDNALAKLSKKLVYAFMGHLEKGMEKTVKIQVKNIPDYDQYKSLKRTIEAFRWVMNVKEDAVGYHQVKSVFLVQYKNELTYLSGMLDKLAKYEFHGRNTDVFTLEYK